MDDGRSLWRSSEVIRVVLIYLDEGLLAGPFAGTRQYDWSARLVAEVFFSQSVSSLTENVLTGRGGWADTQLPDGTVQWTAPTGRTDTTKPGPILATATGEVAIRKLTTEPEEHRGCDAAGRRINEQRLNRQRRLVDEFEKHRQSLATPTPEEHP